MFAIHHLHRDASKFQHMSTCTLAPFATLANTIRHARHFHALEACVHDDHIQLHASPTSNCLTSACAVAAILASLSAWYSKVVRAMISASFTMVLQLKHNSNPRQVCGRKSARYEPCLCVPCCSGGHVAGEDKLIKYKHRPGTCFKGDVGICDHTYSRKHTYSLHVYMMHLAIIVKYCAHVCISPVGNIILQLHAHYTHYCYYC